MAPANSCHQLSRPVAESPTPRGVRPHARSVERARRRDRGDGAIRPPIARADRGRTVSPLRASDRHRGAGGRVMSDDPGRSSPTSRSAVNMTARQLEIWLDSDEVEEGRLQGEGEGESVGHESGRQIIEILGKKRASTRRRPQAHGQGRRLRPPAPGPAARGDSGDPLALLADELGARPGQKPRAGREVARRPGLDPAGRSGLALCRATRIWPGPGRRPGSARPARARSSP